MGGSSSGAAKQFSKTQLQRSRTMFDSGFPLFERGLGMAKDAMQTPEPGFMARALDDALANAQDSAVMQSQTGADANELAMKGTVAGGNTSQVLSGQDVGAKLAQFIRGSQSQRQVAKISQILDAAGVGVGQMGSAGELQTRSLSNQLGAISMLPKQDPTVTKVLAAANLASSIYGAGNGTLWNKPNAQVGAGQLTAGLQAPGIWGQTGTYGPQQFTLGGNAFGGLPVGLGGLGPGPTYGGWR